MGWYNWFGKAISRFIDFGILEFNTLSISMIFYCTLFIQIKRGIRLHMAYNDKPNSYSEYKGTFTKFQIKPEAPFPQ